MRHSISFSAVANLTTSRLGGTKMSQRDSVVRIARVVLGEEEIRAVEAVLRSGNLREGKKCAQFEQALARKVGAKHAISVSSGTAALHVACLATLRPDDEVIVPAFAFAATATAVVMTGARPVFADIDLKTYTIEVEDMRRKITPRTRAIIPVHLYGNACDVQGLQQVAADHDLLLIWDAAQAHGTTYNGHDVGSFGDLVCYSFYPTKNITTGEGGMITTSDPDLYQACRLVKSHGELREYYHTCLGLNYRMTEIAAAIGLVQLRRLDDWVRMRRANAAFLDRSLTDTKAITTPYLPPNVGHSYHQYTIALHPAKISCSRDEFVEALRAEGIEARVHYPRPLHHQPVFRDFAAPDGLENSERAARTVISLPVHPHLSDDELERIARAVHIVADQYAVS